MITLDSLIITILLLVFLVCDLKSTERDLYKTQWESEYSVVKTLPVKKDPRSHIGRMPSRLPADFKIKRKKTRAFSL